MANTRMKSITFPGIDYVYTFADEAEEYSSSSRYDIEDMVIHEGKQ